MIYCPYCGMYPCLGSCPLKSLPPLVQPLPQGPIITHYAGMQRPTAGDCKVCGAKDGDPCTSSCDDDSVPIEQVQPVKCWGCQKQLSAYLDACYSKNWVDHKYCVKCRAGQ